jgi:hypothetical protein
VAADQSHFDRTVRHRAPPDVCTSALYLIGTHWRLARLGLRAVGRDDPFLIWRMFDEERFLAKNLQGTRIKRVSDIG